MITADRRRSLAPRSCCWSVYAQDYPNRAIRVVVGPARHRRARLRREDGELLGQPIVSSPSRKPASDRAQRSLRLPGRLHAAQVTVLHHQHRAAIEPTRFRRDFAPVGMSAPSVVLSSIRRIGERSPS